MLGAVIVHPKRNFVVVEDALAANGPQLKTLLEHGMDFIIVAKPGSNAARFESLDLHMRRDQQQAWEDVPIADGVTSAGFHTPSLYCVTPSAPPKPHWVRTGT